MSTQVLDRIIEDVKTLTPEERRQLIAHLDKEERTAELRRIQAKYSKMGISSVAFAAAKAEELELENRSRR